MRTPTDHDRSGRRHLASAGLVVTVFAALVALSQLVELFINRVLRPNLEEWDWISEVVVILGLLVTTALWGRLRVARTVIAGLERERLKVQAEMAVAARVQRALLPPIPERLHGMTWHAVMEPAGQIGGDYYDFFPLADGRVCVVLADVSGKGVPAAVFVSNTRAVLRAVARERSTPGGVLAAVSETLMADAAGELYVTCIVVMVDTARHSMIYTNAGHPPGVVVGRGPHPHPRPLDAGGPPLGLLPGARYQEERVTLDAGDLVALVSDGITDALDASGKAIPAAIGAVLAGTRDRTPASACAALLEAARRSAGPHDVAGWADDRTVVAFGYAPEPSDV